MNRVQLERLVTPVFLISAMVVVLLFLSWGYSEPVEAQRPTVPSEPRDTPTTIPTATPEISPTFTPTPTDTPTVTPTATSTPEVTEEPTEPAPADPTSVPVGVDEVTAAEEANGRLPLTGIGLSASLIAAALVVVLVTARSLRRRVQEDETAA